MDHFREYPDEPHRSGSECKRDGRVRPDKAERLAHRAEKSARAFGRLRRSTIGSDEPLSALRAPLYILRRNPLLLGFLREERNERVYLGLRQTRGPRVAQELGADGRTQVA